MKRKVGTSFLRFGWTPVLAAAIAMAVPGQSSALSREDNVQELIEESALVGVFRAAIVDPTVFDPERNEARTRLVLTVESLLYGQWDASQLEFLLPEGIAPDGTEELWVETPKFVAGQRYLLFIREGTWHLTPVVGSGAFRITSVAGREILVDNDGRAVLSLSEKSFQRGDKVAEGNREIEMKRRGFITPMRSTTLSTSDAARSNLATNVVAGLRSLIGTFQASHSVRRESGVIYRDAEPIEISVEAAP
jgi:hypothetical protein